MESPRSAIGILMYEHQIILRMIAVMRRKAEAVMEGEDIDPVFIATVVDFIRTYADRCHHGKEEAILFDALEAKQLTAEDTAAMGRLVADHVWARGRTAELVDLSARYFAGESALLPEVARKALELASFYPEHIEREDRHFFRTAVGYLAPDEREAISAACREFDRMLIHEKYQSITQDMEHRLGVQ